MPEACGTDIGMAQIKSFGVFRTARIVAILYAVIVFAFALGSALVTAVSSRLSSTMPIRSVASGLVGLVVLPLSGVVAAFAITALVCWLYNGLAPLIGGIEVEVLEKN
jgi:hypothetical protein